MGHNQMAGSKRLFRDIYFNACLVNTGSGKSTRGEHPRGWCVISAVNSLSEAQWYILTIRSCSTPPYVNYILVPDVADI